MGGAVNLVSDATGVTASDAGSLLTLTSTGYGSSAFVELDVLDEGPVGTFADGLSAT